MKNQALPEWYIAPKVSPIQPGIAQEKRKVGLSVRKALASMGEALALELCSSPCSNSWLGRLEPRAKVLGVFSLIFASTFLHNLISLGTLFAITLIVCVTISMPPRRLIHIWMGVPLFSLALILPAVTSWVTPGTSILTIWNLGHALSIGPFTIPGNVYVTSEGLIVASRFLLRTIDCITLSYLLVSTTDSQILLSGLRRLGMPKIFGMVMTMAQRYVEVILRAAEEIHLAKLSRTISSGPIRNEQRWVAVGMGLLFRKTHRLAGEVHNAMLSRGFDGDLQLGSQSKWQMSDAIWLVLVMVLVVSLILLDRGYLGALIG